MIKSLVVFPLSLTVLWLHVVVCRHLPLAKDLVRQSRQQLVAHLDGYVRRYNSIFEKVCPQTAFLPCRTPCLWHNKARALKSDALFHLVLLFCISASWAYCTFSGYHNR